MTAPTFTAGPNIIVFDSHLQIRATTDLTTDVHAVVVAAGAAVPTATQIEAGTDGDDNAAVDAVTKRFNARVSTTIGMLDLTPATAYTIYIVAEEWQVGGEGDYGAVVARNRTTRANTTSRTTRRLAIVAAGSNQAPVWTLGSRISFDEGVAAEVDLRTVCSDPEGVALLFESIGAALPTGVTLEGGHRLVYDGVGAAGLTTGHELRTDDGWIGQFEVTDDGTGTGRPVSLAWPIGEQWVADTEELVVKSPSGTPDTQFNLLRTWKSGAWAQMAMLHFETDAADAAGVYRVQIGTAATGTAISKADAAASGFTAEIECDVGGTVYSITAEDLLDGTVTPVLDYTMYTGPQCSCFVLGAFLHDSGTPHPHLFGVFEVRAYGASGAVTEVQVDLVLESITARVASHADITADVVLRVDGSDVRDLPAFEIYAGRRYRHDVPAAADRREWAVGSDPAVWVRHDMVHVQASRLIPRYWRDLNLDAGFISGLVTDQPWNDEGALPPGAVSPEGGMAGGGYHEHIGPLNAAAAAYAITAASGLHTGAQIRQCYDAMMAIEDAYGLVQAGGSTSGLTHSFEASPYVRDETTGLPLDLSDVSNAAAGWPGIGEGGDLEPVVSSGFSSSQGLACDIAHAPQAGLLPWLLTGHAYYLEQMQFWANTTYLTDQATDQGWPQNLPETMGQTRSLAWGIGNIASAAGLTPDDHPLKDYFEAALTTQQSFLETSERNGPVHNDLGLTLDFTVNDDTISPYHQDFLTYTVRHAMLLGFAAQMQTYWSWLSQAIRSRFGGGDGGAGWCWRNTKGLTMKVSTGGFSGVYADWGQISAANGFDSSDCGPPESGFASEPGDGASNARGATANARLALSQAVGRSSTEWTRMVVGHENTNITGQPWETSPVFATEPYDE